MLRVLGGGLADSEVLRQKGARWVDGNSEGGGSSVNQVKDLRLCLKALFYPATPRAHWMMVAQVAGRVPMAPLAPSRTGDRRRCRPIGCHVASAHLARRYQEDR